MSCGKRLRHTTAIRVLDNVASETYAGVHCFARVPFPKNPGLVLKLQKTYCKERSMSKQLVLAGWLARVCSASRTAAKEGTPRPKAGPAERAPVYTYVSEW